jgi:hypothetical protein
MASFQMADGTQLKSICLDNTPKSDGKQRRLSLQYTGRSELGTGGQFLTVESRILSQRLTAFTAEAKAGASGKAYVYPKTGDAEKLLAVQVGKVTNHEDFTVDLFAELLGRSENPKKLRAYQRALDPVNNTIPDDKDRWNGALADQPLKQVTFPAPAKDWNCGGALSQFGSSFFGQYSSGEPSLYYDPPASGSSADISRALNTSKLQQGVEKIRGLLNKKTAVRVFVSHHYPVNVSGGRVHPSNRTHYLSIIGHGMVDGKLTFLCIDPWPGGSKLAYKSGIFGIVNCVFMGLLEFSNNALSTPASASAGQAHDYMVLAGP